MNKERFLPLKKFISLFCFFIDNILLFYLRIYLPRFIFHFFIRIFFILFLFIFLLWLWIFMVYFFLMHSFLCRVEFIMVFSFHSTIFLKFFYRATKSISCSYSRIYTVALNMNVKNPWIIDKSHGLLWFSIVDTKYAPAVISPVILSRKSIFIKQFSIKNSCGKSSTSIYPNVIIYLTKLPFFGNLQSKSNNSQNFGSLNNFQLIYICTTISSISLMMTTLIIVKLSKLFNAII